MSPISRRGFMTGLACAGLATLCGGILPSCGPRPGTTEPSPTSESASATLAITPTASPLAATLLPPFAHEALYYTSAGAKVRCDLCPRLCAIADGERGECGVRENRAGVLYSMVYGRAVAVHTDPIEKKPFYHFLPGTQAFSLATAGCNLHCLYCQNWEISQRRPEELESTDLPPAQVVASARQYACPIVAYTYTEPTVYYEYMLDTARLARDQSLRSVVVSAGYINPEPLHELCQAVDAIKIDFKGFNEGFYQRICSGTLHPVLETMKTIHGAGVHLEIVTLVVPTLNDDVEGLRGLCRWIVAELGPDVPAHFSRFHPLYKLTDLPMTPVETLEQARDIALEEGIHYAYVGNVPGHAGDNTYCHHCGKMIILRQGYTIMENHIVNGRCEFCGQPIPGVWQ
jgi:pyruvate formate lyase activating enzyme